MRPGNSELKRPRSITSSKENGGEMSKQTLVNTVSSSPRCEVGPLLKLWLGICHIGHTDVVRHPLSIVLEIVSSTS